MISSFTHEIEHNPEPKDVDTIKISVYLTKIYQSVEFLDLYDLEVIESSSVPVSLRENIYVELTQVLTESGAITSTDGYDMLLDLSRLVDQVTSSDDYTPGCALRVLMTLSVVCPSNQTEEEVLGLLDEPEDVIFDFDHQTQEAAQVTFIEEEVLGLEDELNAIFVLDHHQTEEAARSQNIEEVFRVSLNEEEDYLGLEDEQNAIFVLDHQNEEATRSQIEEVFRISFNETFTVGLKPATKLAVCSLSRKIYNKTSDIVGEIDMCPICFEEFNDGKRIVTLPCGHDFDDECIVEWFVSSHVCPLCRFELPCEDEE